MNTLVDLLPSEFSAEPLDGSQTDFAFNSRGMTDLHLTYERHPRLKAVTVTAL